MRVARPTSKKSLGPADPQTEQLPRWHLGRLLKKALATGITM
jgi:hypothetical protein